MDRLELSVGQECVVDPEAVKYEHRDAHPQLPGECLEFTLLD